MELKETIEKNKQQKRRTYIYGHNTECDWYAIAKNHLLEEENKYIIFTPFFAIHNTKGYILDTMSFFKMSLKAVGEIIKTPKLEMPTKITNPEQLKTYLDRDVEITMKAIKWLKEKLRELGFTPPRPPVIS